MRATHLLFALIPAALSASAATVEDPYVREPAPGQSVLAAYLTIHNDSGDDLVLVGVSSARFQRVEIHRNVEQDGMLLMQQEDSVMIPRHGSLSFSPGGLHLILFHPSHSTKAGDVVPLRLDFDNGTWLQLRAAVRRIEGS